MSAWYLAHDDELLLDCDSADKRTAAGGTHLEDFTRRRLRDGIRAGLLTVRAVFLAPSYTPGHAHVFVRLDRALPLMERMIWQSWLGSDLFRARADLMRAARGHAYPSLLILPAAVAYRRPDATCRCRGKHPVVESADGACETWLKYRGPSPWECFGAPATRASDGTRVAQRWRGGSIPLAQIMVI